MGKTLLVSLVSDQTIPNVQIIKEFITTATDYLFITTKDMEAKGTRLWIEKACGVQGKTIEVNQFSFDDIRTKLASFDFDVYEKTIVNLTGGTKVMTIVANDFFKSLGADIYYVTGSNSEYVKVFPLKKDKTRCFLHETTLSEYLTAYGFEYTQPTLSGISFEQSEKIFNNYTKTNFSDYLNEFSVLRAKRGRRIDETEFSNVEKFLEAIGYTPKRDGELDKVETKYLTGEWFEEYIGLRIKKELNLADENILIGTVLTKNASIPQNSVEKLLGICDDSQVGNRNELDIVFMYGNKFYSIECKSSIIDYRDKKEVNILGETIYKSDSLKSRFGLFAKTSIVTLSDFKTYCQDKDKGQQNNKTREMLSLIERADLSRIKLIDKSLLVGSSSLFELIK